MPTLWSGASEWDKHWPATIKATGSNTVAPEPLTVLDDIFKPRSKLEEELAELRGWAERIHAEAATNSQAVAERDKVIQSLPNDKETINRKLETALATQNIVKALEAEIKQLKAQLKQKDAQAEKKLRQQTAKTQSREQKAVAELTRVEAQADEVSDAFIDEQARANAAVARITQIRDLINKTDKCASCNREFQALLNKKVVSQGCVLACGGCGKNYKG